MQPILVLAIVGIGVAAMSVGFLSNGIALNLQLLGVGMEDIVSPITSASIDFGVVKVTDSDSTGQFFKNIIQYCSFHSAQFIEPGGKLICKLTDFRGEAIAEGFLLLPQGYTGSDRVLIPITQTAFPNANSVKNIHDVTLVALGPDPTTPN